MLFRIDYLCYKLPIPEGTLGKDHEHPGSDLTILFRMLIFFPFMVRDISRDYWTAKNNFRCNLVGSNPTASIHSNSSRGSILYA